MRMISAGFLCALSSLLASPVAAQNIYCNQHGGCSGTTRSGQSVNTYSNPYGGTSGTIGGKSVNLYTNPYGGTSGTIGGQRVNCYTSYGVTRCN